MESNSTWDMNTLINVLNQGNEHIRELQAQLDQPYSAETCKFLACQAQAAFTTAIGVAKLLENPATIAGDVPLLASNSPRRENSGKAFKVQERREMCKRRKTMPRWDSQVSVCSGSSMEPPMDDGYIWRKYGQKDIFGSKFPRGYYRCTHRHTHGCLATKQVQRSDDDPFLFDITFRGAHTCTTHNRRRIPPPPLDEQIISQQFPSPATVGLVIVSGDQKPSSSPSFSLPSTSPRPINSTDQNHLSMPLICGPSNDGGGPNLCASGSAQMAEILSAATSTTSSLMMDFGLGHFDFDTDFLLDFS